MTSTTDTDEHPEVSEISALTDGLLSPSRTADLRDHLAGCELCEDVHASLEEIRGLLGTLPGPPRMPADVAERIDAALAAEALLDSTAPDRMSAVSRETPATTITSVSRETDPAPATTAPGPVTRPAGHPRAASGPGRRAAGTRPRSRRWPRALLGAAAAAAVIGVGGIVIQNAATDTGQHDAQATRTKATEKGAGAASALTSATLESHVHDLLTASGAKKTPDVGTQSSPDSPLRGGTDTVPSCVQQGTGQAETPLAATHSSYKGQDAYLVVLPHPTDPDRVSAYVISSSCVSASPPAPGKVLLTHSYRRD
ncbi:anti-sigma factor family protein [Streptomyces sp. NPDC059788]|uniref:anti-sigma factor family protein n=1 Tax=Streptomyces sp. NPDC059788 TaxID=3346948 RepID=UPI003657C15E